MLPWSYREAPPPRTRAKALRQPGTRAFSREALVLESGCPDNRSFCWFWRGPNGGVTVRKGMSLQRPALDRRPGLALYAAVEEAVEGLIQQRQLAPGDALPPEQELQTLFGVSRATVRQALAQLERRHIVERRQGRGTFLAIPTMELSLPQLTGFS